MGDPPLRPGPRRAIPVAWAISPGRRVQRVTREETMTRRAGVLRGLYTQSSWMHKADDAPRETEG
jgi:hypothetical protein